MAKSIFEISISSPNFPRRKYDSKEKKKLLDYLKSAPFNVAVAAHVKDYVTGKETSIYIAGYDPKELGDYRWFSSDIYHIEHYDARVTDEFFEYVMGNPGPVLNVMSDTSEIEVVCS